MLEQFAQRAKQAHNWTSHYPEKQGEYLIKSYSEQLETDIQYLKDNNIDDATITSYQSRYENLFSSWLNAKSNCFSSFITGGSNFPMRRHAKTQRSEERHYEIFQEWRQRAKKAIIRKAQPVKTFVSELDRYKTDLENMTKLQGIMKACNSIIKKAKGKECTNDLVNAGLSEDNAKKIQSPDFAGRIGFASFNLTNNNANIKRVEERIKELEQKENMLNSSPITIYSFEGGEMVVNYEVDRIQVFFSTRPTRDELTQWKDKGLNSFNWSPSNNAWQRKITANAMHAVKYMLPQLTKIN